MARPSRLIPICVLAVLMIPFLAVVVAAEEAAETPDEETTVEEVIVVTASRTEQRLHEVPAAVTVIQSEELETAPADDYGDILRNVPGLNVSQMSARDIQITGRSATSSLATSELVLIDGRTLYLDFFGFVMWDFLPVNPREIKQVEVVRGPGSAVWGANALSGVINFITKSPRELAGTSILLGGGELGTAYGSITHAGVRDKLSYKLSGSYYEQDAYDRPTGLVPGTMTPYPFYENQGTTQPKGDFRVDYDQSEDTVWSFGGGYAGTDGIIHTGIGPFDIDSGSNLSYVKGSWTRRAAQVNFFANLLDGDATNLLTFDATGSPLLLGFESQTYNLDASNTSVLGQNHILTYGANARKNNFDLSIAPEGDNRNEVGVFVQDEILLGDKVRWLVGARWDDLDPIGSVVSPRTSLLFSPTPEHTFRLSYNRAFRAPSLVENYIDITIANLVILPTGPYLFPSLARGNSDLQEERVDAYELGWVGTFGTTSVAVSVYHNELKDNTDFFPAAFYNSQNPPPGWPLPPIFLDFPPLAGALPSLFTYRNVGEIVNEGLEVSINARPSTRWSWNLNYSYQADPEVTGIPKEETNIPPEHRLNLGALFDQGRWYANGNVNYVDEAFWTDVLDARFHGPTDSYTQVNLGVGVRLKGDAVTLAVIGNNIFDEDVQQHVFGDIIGRKITGQVLFSF